MRFSAAIVAIAVLGAAGSAVAQTPPASADAPVATANSTSSAPITTQQQIERYLATSPAAPDEAGEGEAAEPRRIHGEVGVAVGTGDYRSGYAVVSIPLGETGQLDLAYSRTENGGYVYPGPGYGYGAPPLPLAEAMGGPGGFPGGCLSSAGDGERAVVPDRGGALRVLPERCPGR